MLGDTSRDVEGTEVSSGTIYTPCIERLECRKVITYKDEKFDHSAGITVHSSVD